MKKNKKNFPLVSIILPVYNSSDYLFQTIGSVLNQTYSNWELLVIDDNSFDGSKKIINYYKKIKKIKIYFNKKNNGPDFCRNIGLNKSKGEYIAFLDADDIWLNSKLEKQIKFMMINQISFSCTDYIPFNKNYKLPAVRPKKIFNKNNFIYDTSIATSTMIIKKSSFPKIHFLNGFGFDDYIYKLNLLNFSNCYTLSKSLAFYRMQNHSVSSNKIKNIKYVWNINKYVFNFSYLKNILSIFLISLNSLKKYSKLYNPPKKLSLKEKQTFFLKNKKYLKILNQPCSGPKISIIMPSYNSAKTIRRAIDSIFIQNYKSWELIFVNDGSTDNTKEIIKNYNHKKIKYFENKKRKGQEYSRNFALKKATGYYIAFLDSDDEWLANKLEHQIYFMKNFKLDFSYTNYYYVINNRKIFRDIPTELKFSKLLFENVIGQSTVIYQNNKYKNFNFSKKYRMDFNFWLNILKKKKYVYGIPRCYCKIYSISTSQSKSLIRNLILNWTTFREAHNLSFASSTFYIINNIFYSICKKNIIFFLIRQLFRKK